MKTDNKSGTTAEIVRSCIEKLKKRHPNWSSSQIAYSIGMGRSTFNRLENGLVKNPSPNTVMQLLLALGNNCKLSEVLEMVASQNTNLSDTLKRKFSYVLDKSVVLGSLTEFFTQSDCRPVMLLATTGLEGTDRGEVKNEYGNHGLKVLDELLEAGALAESGGRIRACEYDGEKPFILSREILRDLFLDCLKNRYFPEQKGVNDNWLSFQTEGVDKAKVMGLIRSEFEKTYDSIEKIIRLKENRGSDKIFIGMASDSLLTDNNVTGE